MSRLAFLSGAGVVETGGQTFRIVRVTQQRRILPPGEFCLVEYVVFKRIDAQSLQPLPQLRPQGRVE